MNDIYEDEYVSRVLSLSRADRMILRLNFGTSLKDADMNVWVIFLHVYECEVRKWTADCEARFLTASLACYEDARENGQTPIEQIIGKYCRGGYESSDGILARAEHLLSEPLDINGNVVHDITFIAKAIGRRAFEDADYAGLCYDLENWDSEDVRKRWKKAIHGKEKVNESDGQDQRRI